MPKIRDFLNIFLNFHLSVVFVYLVTFNTNNKCRSITNMLTRVSNFKSYGTAIKNEDRKEFYLRKKSEIFSVL